MPNTKTLVLFFVVLLGSCARKPAASANPAVAHGRELYGKYCVMCHGVGANGYAADNAPSLRTPTFLATATDTFLRDGIARGRPGTAMAGYGKAVGGPLAPAEVDAIIAYLRDGGPPQMALPNAPITGDAKRGQEIYRAQCMRCHGTQTQRISAVHLANSIFLQTASNAFLRWAIEAGRPPTSMVAWRDVLRPQQIDDVVVYLRSLATAPAAPPRVPTAAAAPAIPRGQIVINPHGKQANFELRDGRFVSIDKVKEALDKKQRLIILDARSPSDWLTLHITGSISTPYYDPKSLDDIPNDGTWIIAYCACPHHVSGEVVDQLRKRGYKHTAVLDEGIYAWQHKGYPVVAAPGTLPTPAPPPRDP